MCLGEICLTQVQIKAFSFCSKRSVLPEKVQKGQIVVKCKSFKKSSILEGLGYSDFLGSNIYDSIGETT